VFGFLNVEYHAHEERFEVVGRVTYNLLHFSLLDDAEALVGRILVSTDALALFHENLTQGDFLEPLARELEVEQTGIDGNLAIDELLGEEIRRLRLDGIVDILELVVD
jgi:hypothetical protein